MNTDQTTYNLFRNIQNYLKTLLFVRNICENITKLTKKHKKQYSVLPLNSNQMCFCFMFSLFCIITHFSKQKVIKRNLIVTGCTMKLGNYSHHYAWEVNLEDLLKNRKTYTQSGIVYNKP